MDIVDEEGDHIAIKQLVNLEMCLEKFFAGGSSRELKRKIGWSMAVPVSKCDDGRATKYEQYGTIPWEMFFFGYKRNS